MNIRNTSYRSGAPHQMLAGCASLAASVVLSSVAHAAPATVLSTSGGWQDTFLYQAMPTFNFDNYGYEKFIVLGKSAPGHDLNGLIRIDTAGLSVAPGEKAMLNLFVEPTGSTGFPGVSATAANPVTADLALATSAWSASSVAFGSVGSGSVVSSLAVAGDSQWVQFDITSAVAGWIVSPATNYGLVLTQDAAVFGTSWEGLVFDASGASANRPFLQITPEPAMASLIAVGCLIAGRRRRGECHA